MLIYYQGSEIFRRETTEQLADTRDSIITSKDRKSIAMLKGSVKQLVGKVHKVQYDLMHKPSSLTFNFNTRNKQLDAEIFG